MSFIKGYIPWNKGKKGLANNRKFFDDNPCGKGKGSRKHVSYESRTGENNWRWIKDRTQVKRYWLERNNPEYKQWRIKVYKRDKYKCKIDNNNCQGRLEAHHILGYAKFPELRYEVNNGITLCQTHHPRKRVEEKRLVPFFQELVSALN